MHLLAENPTCVHTEPKVKGSSLIWRRQSSDFVGFYICAAIVTGNVLQSPISVIMDADMAKRAWQRMLSGRRLDLLDPTPVDIEIEDIAHGLAFVARWNGQTVGDFPYSVAEHSLLVEQLFTHMNPGIATRWQLAALLHDAPEYVIGDMISPVKSAVGPDYGALDDRLTAAVHLRFGLPAQIPVKIKRQIKRADKVSAWMEATQIAGFSNAEADKLFGKHDQALTQAFSIKLRPPLEARAGFKARHNALLEEM